MTGILYYCKPLLFWKMTPQTANGQDMDELKSEPAESSVERLLRFVKRLPYATITLIVLSAAIYETHVLPSTMPDSFAKLFLHPLIHSDDAHIIGNLALGVSVVGSLIECWMIRLKWLARYGLLIYCYFISLITAALWWVRTDVIPFGSSGLILAGLAVVVLYYWKFHDQLTLKGWNALGPVGVGFALAFFVQIAYRAFLDPMQFPALSLHGIAFLLSLLFLRAADIGLSSERKTKMLRTN